MAMFVLAQIPALFYVIPEGCNCDLCPEICWNLSIFYDRPTKIGHFFYYYVTAIDALILAICLHWPRGIRKWITRLVLIVTALDLLHIILFAGQILAVFKVVAGVVIVLLYEYYLKKIKK